MIIDSLDKDKQEKIRRYLELVIEKNKTINLTRIDTLEKGMLLHVEDSLSCIEEFNRQDGQFVDIGTGGGFPGVPLAIASSRPGTLIDSVQKKAHAVQEMVSELSLDTQIRVLGMRSEDLAREEGGIYTTAIARAVSSLPVVMELASPLLIRQGALIALRGKEDEQSLEEARLLSPLFGFEMVSIRNIHIGEKYERTICLFEKVDEPKVKLPRRNGMAQKRPFKP